MSDLPHHRIGMPMQIRAILPPMEEILCCGRTTNMTALGRQAIVTDPRNIATRTYYDAARQDDGHDGLLPRVPVKYASLLRIRCARRSTRIV